VDDILLPSSDVSLLLEAKRFLSSNFDMKDLGEASFALAGIGIIIYGILKKVLKKFSMHVCNSTSAPIVKGDKYGSF
jgi:hypothetical protein